MDLTNERFGRLVVIESAKKKHHYICKCDCGNVRTVYGCNLLRDHTRSCGCLSRELTRKRRIKHGKSDDRVYHVWLYLRARNRLCKEFLDFNIFYRDVGDPLKNNYKLITKDKLYSIGTCRWASCDRYSI